MCLLLSSSHELSQPCSLCRCSRAASSLLAGGLSSSSLIAVSSVSKHLLRGTKKPVQILLMVDPLLRLMLRQILGEALSNMAVKDLKNLLGLYELISAKEAVINGGAD
ncbi:hypothetical protein HN51_066344 [Arachis hypogaea]